MPRKIVITSGKGGVGKTTITANLGYFLAEQGANVLLIDMDIGLNNLDIVLGVNEIVKYDIFDVYEGRCRLKQALIQNKYKKNLFLLPSCNTRNLKGITSQNIKLIIEKISNSFDYILFDCPAGIDIGFHKAVACADEAIVVLTPCLTSISDANKAISVIKSYKLDNLSIVINRARGDLIIERKMMNPNDIGEILKTNILGVLPEDDSVFLSLGYNLPQNSESYKAYKIFARNIIQNKKNIYDVTSKYLGFWGSLKRGIRKIT